MFAKLLRHDFKSVGKATRPLCIGALIITMLGFLASTVQSYVAVYGQKLSVLAFEAYQAGDTALHDTHINQYTVVSLGSFALSLSMLFVFLLLGIAMLTVMVLVAVNFYKTLITDQGYLTFTLPVSPTKILLSKILNGFIWNVIALLILVLGAILIVVPSVSINEQSLFIYLFDFKELDKMNLTLTIILLIENAFFGILASEIFYFFAIFLGGIVAKKHKLLAGGAVIVVGHIIYYIVEQVFSTLLTVGAFLYTSGEIWEDVAMLDPLIITNITLLFSFVSSVAIAVVFFFITNWLMNKKLNLP